MGATAVGVVLRDPELEIQNLYIRRRATSGKKRCVTSQRQSHYIGFFVFSVVLPRKFNDLMQKNASLGWGSDLLCGELEYDRNPNKTRAYLAKDAC